MAVENTPNSSATTWDVVSCHWYVSVHLLVWHVTLVVNMLKYETIAGVLQSDYSSIPSCSICSLKIFLSLDLSGFCCPVNLQEHVIVQPLHVLVCIL